MTLHNYNNPLAIGGDKFTTTKICAANDYINNYITPHRLHVLSGHTRVKFDCQRWHVGQFQVCDFSYGDCEVEVNLNRCEERGVFVVVPLSGQVEVSSKGRQYSLLPGSLMAFTTQDAEHTWFHDSRSFRNLNISTSYDALRKFLVSELEAPIKRDITFTPGPIHISHEFGYLLDYIRWFSAQVHDRLGNILLLNSLHLARHMNDMLMSMLVSSVQNNYQELYHSQNEECTAPYYVRGAEEYMRSNACDSITVKDVARNVGVAMRTLHMGFQRYRNYSVCQFLRNERLFLARQKLFTARCRNLSVTDIAYSCGFLHLSKFAVAYQKRYGEKPSDTLRKGN